MLSLYYSLAFTSAPPKVASKSLYICFVLLIFGTLKLLILQVTLQYLLDSTFVLFLSSLYCLFLFLADTLYCSSRQ